jgi:two-component system response regulator AtoC
VAERHKGLDTNTSTYGARVLIADDDVSMREVLTQLLEEEGYKLDEAASGQEVLEKVATTSKNRPDIVLLDIGMPDTDGIQVLQTILEQGIDIPVVVHAVRRVLTYEKLKQEILASKAPTAHPDPTERIVGSSPEIIDIFKTIGRVARTQATVLVTGETGTGKELMTEAIHNASDRRSGPLVKVNCAALPETLLESELFGHEKGSFTGALAQHKGRFEAANKGTIFLDEVGEMSLATQKKLLRVLQEREFERVGGNVPVKVDVRVIAATNRNLRDEVLDGRFREDLFYRLNVIEVHMPSLRDRKEDIPALVSHFLDKHRYSGVAMPARISEEAVALLMEHEWPGNVRELENIIQRAVVLSRGDLITPEHIVFQSEMTRYILDVDQKVRAGTPLNDMLAEVRRQAITTAIRLNEFNARKAAEQLDISLEDLEALAAELNLPIAEERSRNAVSR